MKTITEKILNRNTLRIFAIAGRAAGQGAVAARTESRAPGLIGLSMWRCPGRNLTLKMADENQSASTLFPPATRYSPLALSERTKIERRRKS
jgi:hypothetical protein